MSLPEKRCEEVVVKDNEVTVCNWLLFKGEISYGTIAIKCHSCKKITVIKARRVRNRIYKPVV